MFRFLSLSLYFSPSLLCLFLFPSPPSFRHCSLPLSSLLPHSHSYLPLSLLPPSPQGLYEYAKPAWQERPRPQVDEGKVKSFGQNVAPRPLNPSEKQLQLYPVAMEINGVEAPRYAVHSLSLYLSSSQILVHPSSIPPRSPPPFINVLYPSLLSFRHFSYPSLHLHPSFPSASTAPSRCTLVELRSVQMPPMPDLS